MPSLQPVNHGWIWRIALFLAVLALLITNPGESQRTSAAPGATIAVVLSNPACVQVGSACSLHFSTVSASGSDQSFSRLEILVNGQLRAWFGGFFETSATFDPRMAPDGFAVACGLPNASGNPDYGKSYLVAVNGYLANGTSASASTNVYCPSFEAKTYIPLLYK